LRRYPAGYDYYLEKTKAESARAGLTAGDSVVALARGGETTTNGSLSRREQKRVEAEQRQARSRDRRDQQQQVKKLEDEIHHLEKRQVELAAELENPDTYGRDGRALQINRELSDTVAALQARTSEWEHAATKLTEMSSPQ
jgi:ATP-binding cassette subfamily F protein 3